MHLAVLGAIASIVAIIAFLWAVARFVAKVDENTRATDRLNTSFNSFTEQVQSKLTDHEVRITVLEKADKPE